MKKLKNKLLIFLAISTLILPIGNVFAIEGEETNPGDPTPSPTIEPTPSTSPEPSADPTPSPTPSAPTDSKENTEAQMTKIRVSKGTWDREFTPSIMDYKIIVDTNVSAVVISATSEYGSLSGDTGTRTIRNGENIFHVTVTSKDGKKKKTYTLNIIRTASNLTLKSLKIQGQSLNEEFSPEKFEYTATIPYTMESITVQAVATSTGVEVQIEGNENLKVGTNFVKIRTENATGEHQEYLIVVTRESEEKENNEDLDDESNSVKTSSSTSQITAAGENPNKGNTLKYILVVIFCVILLIVSGLGIYFYIRTGDNQKRKQKKREKLAKKQAKLNQELSGLETEEVNQESEEEYEDMTSAEDIIDTDDMEKTIEFNEEEFEENTKEIRLSNLKNEKSDKNILEDFDDLFLDE